MVTFSIKILNQNWLDSEDLSNTDLCSHGEFEIIIDNQVIVSQNDKLDWTISTSVFSLLRSIEPYNHAEERYCEKILHCGQLLMLSCPICIDWDLIHEDETVTLKNVHKQFSVNTEDIVYFKEINIKIDRKAYAKEILKVAEEVKQFFDNQPKRILYDEWESSFWETFWSEFNDLFDKGKMKYSTLPN
jgi:hypothetical protein